MKDDRCRVCLGFFSYSTDLFIGDEPIYRRLEMITHIKIVLSKNLPSKICESCLTELNAAFKFKSKFNTSHQILQKTLNIEENNVKLKVNCELIESNCIKDTNDYTDCKENKTIVLNEECSLENEFVENVNKTHLIEKEQKTKVKRLKKGKTNSQCGSNEENSKRKEYRKHMCAICGKKFILNGNLIAHERIHSGDKPFRCKVCNQSFSQSGHLTVHERTHSGFKPYQCEQCSKCFTVSQSLKKHLRTHTGERPYSCKICSKSFGTSYHLSAHIKTHSGKKKYECNWLGCRTGFSTAQEMSTHKSLHIN